MKEDYDIDFDGEIVKLPYLYAREWVKLRKKFGDDQSVFNELLRNFMEVEEQKKTGHTRASGYP